MCWCLSGKANNINASGHFKYTTATLQSLHPGTPQCKSLQLQASRVTKATATVQPNCVHKGCSKAGSVNQHRAVPSIACWACPESSVFTGVRARLGCVALAVLFSGFRSGRRLIFCTDWTVMLKSSLLWAACLHSTVYCWQQSSRWAFDAYNSRIHP